MKVGDMVRHRDAADWTPPLGNGLLVELARPHARDEAMVWSVLWSGDGKVVRHRGYELRLVEALAVAEYKACAQLKTRNAVQSSRGRGKIPQ